MMPSKEHRHIPAREESRILGEVRRHLPDLWDEEAEYLLIRKQGSTFKLYPLTDTRRNGDPKDR